MTARFWIYRLFTADDRLLYVGIAQDVDRRMREHRSVKDWFGDVTRIEVSAESYLREEALHREAEAIRTEHPVHNWLHRTPGTASPTMSTAEAHAVLAAHATSRALLPEAVAEAHRHRVPQTEIARRSGLSRDGVRKILARQETGPDATQATARDQASQNSHATENGDPR